MRKFYHSQQHDLEINMLSELSQIEKDKHYDFTYTHHHLPVIRKINTKDEM